MNKRAILAIFLMLVFAVPSGLAASIISPGDFFPDYRFDSELSPADSAYLGVAEVAKRSGSFDVKDIWGEVLVLELFNGSCFNCRQNAPLLNKAYGTVAADPVLSTRVRFLGVGVGDSMQTVNDFRREFDVLFPLVPDPGFAVFTATGNPGGTPYTMILKRTSRGFMLVSAHSGVLDSADGLVRELIEVLAGDAEALAAGAEEAGLPPWVEKDLAPPLGEDEIETLVLESMERAGYGSVGLYSVELPGGDRAFIGESNRGKVFARVISRLPLCDVCKPVHFILTLNPRGEVVDFDAITVTKHWNVEWNEEDVDAMRKRLLGLSVFDERPFDPEVDAVSTATMSSSLIFDSVGRMQAVLEVLRQGGHL